MNRAADWLRQAENDLDWARHSLSGGFFSQTCFIAQQAGENALKAYCYSKGYDLVKSHSLFQIVRSLGEDGVLEDHARELDLYYISGRYPGAFPAGAPFELITEAQANRALAAAEAVVGEVTRRMEGP